MDRNHSVKLLILRDCCKSPEIGLVFTVTIELSPKLNTFIFDTPLPLINFDLNFTVRVLYASSFYGTNYVPHLPIIAFPKFYNADNLLYLNLCKSSILHIEFIDLIQQVPNLLVLDIRRCYYLTCDSLIAILNSSLCNSLCKLNVGAMGFGEHNQINNFLIRLNKDKHLDNPVYMKNLEVLVIDHNTYDETLLNHIESSLPKLQVLFTDKPQTYLNAWCKSVNTDNWNLICKHFDWKEYEYNLNKF